MTPLRSLPDLLAFLPYHVGFELRDALVVLGLEKARLALVERADLPDSWPLHPEVLVRLVGGVRRLAPCLDTVLVVAYTTGADPAPALPLLVHALDDITVATTRAVVVSGSTWREWDDDVPRPLPEPADVPLVAEYVGRGIAPLSDRAALRTALARTPSPEVDAAVRTLVAHGVHTGAGFRAWNRLVAAGVDLPGPFPGPTEHTCSGGAAGRLPPRGGRALHGGDLRRDGDTPRVRRGACRSFRRGHRHVD
ncbi:DUF4192 family protein [Mobilicoccus pelagius]|uniref:Uncharacterized protein n=1 Tax=Mobilicoccus pelagius NBRC 104925 TaxID=1089455 RepID=H5UPV1_9MICO|nr:DUF4192 family protein [Mobilicoccus pelagius]GAB47756.1 hypothetical protein MOPEL_029_00350 [Mobilicoccus pelagius NBRC 104925]